MTVGHIRRRKEEKRTDLLTSSHPSPLLPPRKSSPFAGKKKQVRTEKGGPSITDEGLKSARLRRPNHAELRANHLVSIYYFLNQLLCQRKPGFYSPPTRDGAARSLISRHPHHIAAAACVYLCSRVPNLSIYVCARVFVAQDALRLSTIQAHTHTHHRPQITSRISILGKAQDLRKVPTEGGCMITSSRRYTNALSPAMQQ